MDMLSSFLTYLQFIENWHIIVMERRCKMGAALPVFPISDLRYNTKEILRLVKEQPIVLTQRGRAKAVLVDFEAYNQLVKRQEALERARDAFLLQRAQETARKYLPFEALLRQHEELFGEKLDLPSAEKEQDV
jgi:prevent-host-death family protein